MVRLGAVFRGTTPGSICCIFRDVVNCAGGCGGSNVFLSDAFQLNVLTLQ